MVNSVLSSLYTIPSSSATAFSNMLPLSPADTVKGIRTQSTQTMPIHILLPLFFLSTFFLLSSAVDLRANQNDNYYRNSSYQNDHIERDRALKTNFLIYLLCLFIRNSSATYKQSVRVNCITLIQLTDYDLIQWLKVIPYPNTALPYPVLFL